MKTKIIIGIIVFVGFTAIELPMLEDTPMPWRLILPIIINSLAAYLAVKISKR
jgi:hypothetical protein